MFFMIGINEGRKQLPFDQLIICDRCGRYGHYQVFMTYTVLSLFFIPILKWNKRFYVQTSCCQTVYELSPEIGKRIARGESLELRPEDLTIIKSRSRYQNPIRTCLGCGYSTDQDFDFCPKCGRSFTQ